MDYFAHQPAVRRRRGGGFSLVELLAVVVILGIVANIAIAMLGGTATGQLRAAADQLASDLSFARIRSITHADQPHLVVFDEAADQYHVARASKPAQPISNPADGQPYRVRFGSEGSRIYDQVRIESVEAGGDQRVRFEMYGQLRDDQAAKITLDADGHRIDVTVPPGTGEASVGPLK